MNGNLNLCEILKNCPKGTMLYSILYGNVEFVCVQEDCEYPIIIRTSRDGCNESVTSDGRTYKEYDGECTLFPSKKQHDWGKWVCPNKPKFDPKTLQPFQKVLVKGEGKDDKWTCNLFAFYDDKTEYCFECLSDVYINCVPYNDDTKHLVGTTDEAPEYYKYWKD